VSRRLRALAITALLLLALLPLRAAGVGAVAPASEYLALGDSLATGVGSSKCPIGCAAKGGSGYVADYAAILKSRSGADLTVKDLAVNGETTDSFIGDYFTNPASKSQLARAVATLKADGAAIGAITLDIGGNDALNHHGPNFSIEQKLSVLSNVRGNLNAIVSALLTAAASNGSAPRLTLLAYYEPYGPADPDLWALGGLNQAIIDTAAEYGLSVAQPYGAFVGQEKSLTWIACRCPLDIHPNDSGYSAIAKALDVATGGATAPSGSVQGTVRDDSGNPLAGATVWYGGASVQTDASGVYRLNGLPAGVALTLGAYVGDPTTGTIVTQQFAAGALQTQNFALSAPTATQQAAMQQAARQQSYTRAGYAHVVAALVRATIDQTAQQAAYAGLHAVTSASEAAKSPFERIAGHLGDAFQWLGQRFGG
jgi:lysophospholipase L1-like esterase